MKKIYIISAILISTIVALCGFFLISPLPIYGYPDPYPNSDISIKRNVSRGNCCSADEITYLIGASYSDIQSHYDREMRRYCSDDWNWLSGSRNNEKYLNKYSDQISADCQIKNNPLRQKFTVIIYYNNESESFVYQENHWESL
jgi:hypothetical protein